MFSLQFSSIGMPELLVLLVIVLLLFGTKRLPELGSSLGRALSEFKRGLYGIPSKEVPSEKQREPLPGEKPHEEAPSS